MDSTARRGADKLVSYFERLEEAEGARWGQQLLVAQIWRSLLQSGEAVARDEFLRLALDLKEEEDLGTAYDELVYLIGRWAEK